jgi:hypothetical protein
MDPATRTRLEGEKPGSAGSHPELANAAEVCVSAAALARYLSGDRVEGLTVLFWVILVAVVDLAICLEVCGQFDECVACALRLNRTTTR